MDSIEQFGDNVRWTGAEKKVARRAFDQALERHLSTIIAEAKRMMANVASPSDLWGVEAYLTESRKNLDRIYQFRYSDLLRVFSVLMRDEWLHEADLVGLQSEKIAAIKRSAEALRRMLRE
jgi:Photoprotection regulator fluorescence recovery protein